MMLKIFTTYDSKAEAYLQPFFLPSRGEAIRAWQDVVNDQKTQFNKYPEDFTLFELGEFDSRSGTITTNTKISLGNAIEFKKQ